MLKSTVKNRFNHDRKVTCRFAVRDWDAVRTPGLRRLLCHISCMDVVEEVGPVVKEYVLSILNAASPRKRCGRF